MSIGRWEPPAPFVGYIYHRKARIRKKKIKKILKCWYELRYIEIYQARKWGMSIAICENDKYMTRKPHECLQEMLNR